MRTVLAYVALSSSLIGILACAATSAVPGAPKQKGSVERPPVREIYDPQDGPFIVRLNSHDEIDQETFGVIANAVRMWSGPGLQAFVICFRAQQRPVAWNASDKALKVVAHELKVKSAQVVVMPNGGLCHSSYRPDWPGPYVEITGVIRL